MNIAPSVPAIVLADFLSNKPLSFDDFLGDVRSVHAFGHMIGCDYFDNQKPTFAAFSRYISCQPNMFLVEDAELPDDLLGAVVKKKETLESGKTIDMYYVLVSCQLADEFIRCFVTAHEIGHTLLHGRLMKPGMYAFRRDLEWHRDSRYRLMMEVEANLFAFYSTIPKKMIDIARATAQEEGYEFDLTLWCFVSHMYKRTVDINMISERILIDDMERAKVSVCEKRTRYEDLTRSPSWLMTGVSPSTNTCTVYASMSSEFQIEPAVLERMERTFNIQSTLVSNRRIEEGRTK